MLVAVLIFGAVILLKKRKKNIAETPTATQPSLRVKTVALQSRDLQETSSFLARLETVNRAEISTKLSGRIDALLVRESQQIRQGELLVRIDDTELLASLAGLKAQLVSTDKQRNFNRLQYERNLELFKAGGLAQEKLEASEVAYSAAVARVQDVKQKIRGLENQLDYLHIKAPFDGIVGTIFLRAGDLVSPGRPVVTLNALEQKLTFSFVPGQHNILSGQDVLLDGVTVGKLSTLYNDAQNGLSVVEVALDKRMDRPSGSFLSIDVVTKRATGCSVPAQALLHRASGESIMVYQGGHFAEQVVTVTARDRNFAIIDPCVSEPVAVASEAKLSLLPTHGKVSVFTGKNDE
jgi:RND family efflux transporter MFP subunit